MLQLANAGVGVGLRASSGAEQQAGGGAARASAAPGAGLGGALVPTTGGGFMHPTGTGSSADAAFAAQQHAAAQQHMALYSAQPPPLPAAFTSGPQLGLAGFHQPYMGVAPGVVLPQQPLPFGIPAAGGQRV
ncbi:MAG: hypothetical protein ACRC1H_17375 [Caldilineaceae bacterium]